MNKYIKVLAILLISSMLLTGCAKKNSLDKDEFCDSFSSTEFTCSTVSESYNDVDEAAFAIKDDISIYYMDFNSKNNAIDYYNELKESILSSDDIKYQKEVVNSNYSKLTVIVDDEYHIISRIDDTFVFVDTSASNQKAVDEAFETIGY